MHRILAALGGALLVGSIFLPRPGLGSLAGELTQWSETLMLTLEAEGVPLREIAPVVGVVMAVLYVPVVGAVALLLALLPSRVWRSRIAAVALLGMHTVFLGLLTALGIAAVVVADRWLPVGAYWVTTIGGALTLLAVWFLAFRADPARRLCRMQLPPLVVLALLFAGVSMWLAVQDRHAWSPVGLAASAAGALVALSGAALATPPKS